VRKLTSLCASIFFCSLSLVANDVKLRVLDPQHRPVPNARVLFYSADHRFLGESNSDVQGNAALSSSAAVSSVRVLVPGFAVTDHSISSEAADVVLAIAAQPETVVVTATANPTVSEQTGFQTEALNPQQLTNRQPTALSDALDLLPGAVIAGTGQRGALTSLFVRGGDSRYNKVLIDGVPVNDPGGTFDFGSIPMSEVDRVEMVRGSASALYGTDAMTSTVQLFTRTGTSLTPELRFGADGGNFSTAHGYASLAGAYKRLDYNLFGDQFNTNGSGVNDDYGNSSQGANLGVALAHNVALRFNVRHSSARTGVQNEWWFNGAALFPPDQDQFARQNRFLSSVALSFKTGSHWNHTVSGYEYHHTILNVDNVSEPARAAAFDFPFNTLDDLNRAGFNYQGEWTPTSGTRTTVGYNYENENGYDNDPINSPGLPLLHGLRRNHTIYLEQFAAWKRLTALAGGSYVNNEFFGTRLIPRAAITSLLSRGNGVLSGTRVRAAYGQAVKEPRFEEVFGTGAFLIVPNPHLRPEQSRSIETGITQNFFHDRLSLAATYFHQNFADQIAFETIDFTTFAAEFVNLNRTLAHGAELEMHARVNARLSIDGGYFYTSTQILSAPQSFDPLQSEGSPLLRRPKHAGKLLLNYSADRWGADLGGSFIGRRPDEDFLGLGITHAAGYALVNAGGWYRLNRFATAYTQIENLLDRQFNAVLGYPALPVNFRAGLRFRIGGD
jgi:outer membrane cobalamin receptor